MDTNWSAPWTTPARVPAASAPAAPDPASLWRSVDDDSSASGGPAPGSAGAVDATPLPYLGAATAAGSGRSTPIRSLASVRTLLETCGDHRLTHQLVCAADSYEQLAAMPLAELAGRLGAWAVQLQLPRTVTTARAPLGIELVTRYDQTYPHQLDQLEDPPVLVQVAGRLPTGPSVTVGGTQRPGLQGKAAAAAAVVAAGQLGAPLVAVVDGGCGQAALQQAAARGMAAVAVTPYRLDRPGLDDLLIGQVLEAGGAALCVHAAAGEEVEVLLRYASRVAAALSPVVVLAELGVYAGGGVVLARTAVGLGRYLVVPSPQADPITPIESSGGAVLGRSRRFSDEWFGSSAHISDRVAKGRPAADAVVSDYVQLLDALSWGLGTQLVAAAQPALDAGQVAVRA